MSNFELGVGDKRDVANASIAAVSSKSDFSKNENAAITKAFNSDDVSNSSYKMYPQTTNLKNVEGTDNRLANQYEELSVSRRVPLASEETDEVFLLNKSAEIRLGVDATKGSDHEDETNSLEGVTIESRIGNDSDGHDETEGAGRHDGEHEGEGLLHASDNDRVDGYIIVRGKGDGVTGQNGTLNRHGEHDDRHFPETFTIETGEDVNVNVYQQKKNLAQGMMDLALLSANANQLRYVLESPNHAYYIYALTGIALSIIFQIAVGVGLILNSRYDVNKQEHICKANKINNLTVLGVFLVTIINVFITSFGPTTTIVVQTPPLNVSL